MRSLIKVLFVLCALIIVLPAHAIDGTQLLTQVDRNLTPED